MTQILALLVVATVQSSATPQTPEPAESADSAWTVLHSGLTDKSADKRAKAVHALGLLTGNAKAEQFAETALKDTNSDVRSEAANALGGMGATGSIPVLKGALNDKEIKVVVAAANALYTFKDPAAYEVYYAMLTGERKGKTLIESQLDMLKDRKELEKLMFQTGIGFVPFGGMGFTAFETLTRGDSSPVQALAAQRLWSDPDPKTAAALAKACSDKNWRVRVAVVDAVSKRGDPSILYAVGPLLYDGNDSVRYEAAAADIHLSTKPVAAARVNRAHTRVIKH